MEKLVRLNKVIKELNISHDTAVKYLEENGQEIEPRLTAKINQIQYDLLVERFKKPNFNKYFIDFNNNNLDSIFNKNVQIENFILDYKKTFSEFNKFKKTLDTNEINKNSRQEAIKEIKKAYRHEELVLVLGAGTSIEFGIPSWNGLLQKLMVHTIEKDNNKSNTISQLFNNIFKPNPLISGRYLQNYFETNDASFEEMVKEILYKNIDRTRESNLIEEIIRICVAPGKSPNLNSIITYNFDDIIERKLEKTKMGIPFKSIYGIGMKVENEQLPIYHVHGYLPEKGKIDKQNTITFGETNYHEQYSDIYSWNNIVQINKFRENTCLFIGTSLTDPNTRRLLDIALKQKGNKKTSHYIFKKRIERDDLVENLEIEESNIDNKEDEKKQIEIIEALIYIYEKFEENDSESFGVKTIWVNNWSEIPEILSELKINIT